ncbi:MAG: Rod shape-determining protein MreD [Bacteroidota bacterium]|jgi:hypothetical protein|nr:Rod shape-determining protein MreD [Bacteroidota bacterium]
MNSKNTIIHLFYFIIFIGLQVVIIRNVVLFNVAFCYLYIAFLLLLPFEAGRITLMMIGFFTGLAVDVFYDSFGIHAAACVLMMYIRPIWINLITPRGGYELEMRPTLSHMGFQWFSTYVIPLILIHHFALFFIESGGINLILYTALKVASSAAFTYITIVVVQYLFYSTRRSSI